MKTKTVRTLFALLTAVFLLLCAAIGTAESTTDWPEQPKATPLTAEEAETLIRLALGMDPSGKKDITWITAQIPQYMQNPEQYKQDLWDGIFGTWADGISLAGDPKDDGRVVFVMELPAPVAMPDAYSVSYARKGENGQEFTTTLERDADGNIHYIDGDTELVYVRTEGKYRRYAVTAGGFGKGDGVLLSARSVRKQTKAFWNCADQTFLKWQGMDFIGETEYLGRAGSKWHAEPGTITFSYQGELIFDTETGICLDYAADELIRGAVFTVTDEGKILIDIAPYDIGGDEMSFRCTRFETENVSFGIPKETEADNNGK